MSVEILDLTNYRDRNGARVPEGNYLVQVEEVEVGKSSSKGTPQWTVYLQIIGGDQDGQTLIDRLYLTEGAMFRVVGFLNGIGVKTSKKKMKIDTSKLVGRKARVDVADGEPYNGTIRSDIKGYQRFVSAKSAPTEDADELEDQYDESDTEDGEEEEEAVAPKPSKTKQSKKSKPAPEPVDDEDDEDEDDDETSDDGELDLDDLDV